MTWRSTVAKEIIIKEKNEHEGQRIWCAWEDCAEYGLSIFEHQINEAKPGFAKKLARYVFCCEAHLEYFRTSHIPGHYGRLRGEVNGRFL